jgi:SAM-dependent methyltransferase
MAELYDRIGRTYTATRRTDPRIARAILEALGDAQTVVNVGAGTGAYEPSDRKLVAVEPSPVMIAQRPVGAAPVIRARAEELPFADGAFDAAMAVLSDHHWRDRGRGLRELCRVARRRVVLFNANPSEAGLFWLTTEYLPGFLDLIPDQYGQTDLWERRLAEAFGSAQLIPVPIPHDCQDGFYAAFWRRPEAYLEPAVRSGISVFAQLDDDHVRQGMHALRGDLESGRWRERHRELLELAELHLGFYVVLAELGSRMGEPKLPVDDGR